MNDGRAELDLTDINGFTYRISGDQMGLDGIELALDPTGLLDAPVATLWQETAFGWGAYWAGMRWNKRELVLPFNILGDTAEEWYGNERRFRAGWSYTKDCILRVTTEDDSRTLRLRLGQHTETKMQRDPRLTGSSLMVVTAVAGWPFWAGRDITREWELASGTSGSGSFGQFSNDSDMPMYACYSLDAPGKWTLPDFSFGSDEFARGAKDVARTVSLPKLSAGQAATVNTDPTEETVVTDDKTLEIWTGMNGEDFLYPIPPGARNVVLPISVTNATPGVSAQLRLFRNFQRGWGIVG